MSPEPTLDNPSATPERIGDYELVRRIEQDDFASLWLARRHDPVRLIQLNAELADDQELETAFVQHAEAMASVDHPGILRVLDSATEGGMSFMVTERAEGVTLAELMLASQGGCLAFALLHRVLLEACEVLRVLHALPGAASAKQLIHGDLTPHTLFVNGEGDVVLAPTCLGAVSCSAPRGKHSGRLAYKAPEQLAKVVDLDGRADIFALGATLWHALSGEAPFRAASAAELVKAVQTGAPPNLPFLGSESADSILALLRRTLVAEPDQRMTESELTIELERLGGAASQQELGAAAAAAGRVLESGDLRRRSDPWLIRFDAPRAARVKTPPALAAPAKDTPSNGALLVAPGALEKAEPAAPQADSGQSAAVAEKPEPAPEATSQQSSEGSEPAVEATTGESASTAQAAIQPSDERHESSAEAPTPAAAEPADPPPAPSAATVEMSSEWPPDKASTTRRRRIGLIVGAIVALGIAALAAVRRQPGADRTEGSDMAAQPVRPAATRDPATENPIEAPATAGNRQAAAALASGDAVPAGSTEPTTSTPKPRARSRSKIRKPSTAIDPTRKPGSTQPVGTKPTERRRRPKP